MKQKIVIRVCSTMCCDKCRSKAMTVAAAMCGVESVAIDGECRDKVVVVGECVDSVNLTIALRKKVRHAQLLQVSEVNKDDKKPPPSKTPPPPPPPPSNPPQTPPSNPPPPPSNPPPPPPSNPPPPPTPPSNPPPPVTFVCHYCHCHPAVGYVNYSCYCYCYCHCH